MIVNWGGLAAAVLVSALAMVLRDSAMSRGRRSVRRALLILAIALPILALLIPLLPWRLMAALIVILTIAALLAIRAHPSRNAGMPQG